MQTRSSGRQHYRHGGEPVLLQPAEAGVSNTFTAGSYLYVRSFPEDSPIVLAKHGSCNNYAVR